MARYAPDSIRVRRDQSLIERPVVIFAESQAVRRMIVSRFRKRHQMRGVHEARCAITGEKTLPALEAGHIRPYAKSGPHEIRNGLLLRSDLHNLFDLGYLTVTLDYRVEVSRRIREEFENGRHYYALHGQSLAVLPRHEGSRPAPEFLQWHHGIFKS
jgi:putative restriction endonuclease